MALSVLRLSRRFVPPTAAAALFAAVCVPLRLRCTAPTTLLTIPGSVAATRAAGLIVAAALLSTATALRLRLGLLGLRLTPLRLPTASALLFATSSALLADLRSVAATRALLFVATSAVRLFLATPAVLFVAPAPRFSAFCPLMGTIPPAPLPASFRVGAGDRDVGQRKRTADGDRATLSASVS